ncbi:hypothetical protein KFE25_000663 [Diacronema lutheri]|uniref:Uncharacterized protein n=1 Tax=Diacronema lutheri TaxID=2081491 RepID=A0A8J6CA87_DIALT|nr:hypothetical protein KFE25_000663 [Diacronema lutheri]
MGAGSERWVPEGWRPSSALPSARLAFGPPSRDDAHAHPASSGDFARAHARRPRGAAPAPHQQLSRLSAEAAAQLAAELARLSSAHGTRIRPPGEAFLTTQPRTMRRERAVARSVPGEGARAAAAPWDAPTEPSRPSSAFVSISRSDRLLALGRGGVFAGMPPRLTSHAARLRCDDDGYVGFSRAARAPDGVRGRAPLGRAPFVAAALGDRGGATRLQSTRRVLHMLLGAPAGEREFLRAAELGLLESRVGTWR